MKTANSKKAFGIQGISVRVPGATYMHNAYVAVTLEKLTAICDRKSELYKSVQLRTVNTASMSLNKGIVQHQSGCQDTYGFITQFWNTASK